MTAGAKILNVTRQTLNNIVNGRSGISPEMTPTTLPPSAGTESKIKVPRQHVPQELYVH